MPYARPILCRICEFPVVDTGIPVADIDHQKLSRWWLQTFETDLEDDEEALCTGLICQFCVLDAKYVSEMDVCSDDKGCDWWTCQGLNPFSKKFYYEDDIIRPCRVEILPLHSGSNSKKNSREENYCAASSNITETQHSLETKNSKMIPTACPFCGEMHKSKSDAYKHINDMHKDLEVFRCTGNCLACFKSDEERIKHQEETHKSRLRCHCCNELFRNGHYLWKHLQTAQMRSNSKGQNVTCCGEVFKNISSLCRHVCSYYCALRQGFCSICKILMSEYLYNKHVKEIHGDLAIKCDYLKCKKYFTSELDKEQHFEKAHARMLDFVQCSYCPMKIASASFRIHMLKRHAIVVIRCTFYQCKTFFLSESERDQHVLSVHPKNPKCLSCIYCKKLFSCRITLSYHIRRVHSSIKKRCKIQTCPEYFISEDGLKAHMLEKHKNGRNIQCRECNFKTYTMFLLKRHNLHKHGTENIKCSECPLIFRSMYSMNIHRKQAHRASIACTFCNKTLKHLKSHAFPMPCKVCSKTFQCRTLLFSHRKTCAK